MHGTRKILPALMNALGRMRSVPCEFEAAMIDLRRLPEIAKPLFSSFCCFFSSIAVDDSVAYCNYAMYKAGEPDLPVKVPVGATGPETWEIWYNTAFTKCCHPTATDCY